MPPMPRVTEADHRMGRCGDVLCMKWYKSEMSLGMPEDWQERKAWYEAQKGPYASWQLKTFCPSWTLAEGKCRNCKAETLTVKAGGIHLCVMWCLNTEISFYPTGQSHPHAKDFLRHAKTCPRTNASTLHSWSLTSKYLEALKTAFMFSNPQTGNTPSSSTSSCSARANPMKRSSSALHLPNLVLSSRQSPSSNIPRS